MTTEIAIILLLDGIANGAIYLLAGLGLVLIFSVTRVVFVPFATSPRSACSRSRRSNSAAARHDLGGRDPGSHRNRHRRGRPSPFRRGGENSALAAVLWRAAADPLRAGVVRRIARCAHAVQIVLALVLVLRSHPCSTHRVPARRRRLGLVLLIIALALHFALSGLA